MPYKTSFVRRMVGVPVDRTLCAEGLMYTDLEALSLCQIKCTERLAQTVQLEQESYLNQHPEIIAGLKLMMQKLVQRDKKTDVLQQAAEYFLQPLDHLDKEIREFLHSPAKGPYLNMDFNDFDYYDIDLLMDLRDIHTSFYPPTPFILPTPTPENSDTVTSSFISLLSSVSTPKTPEYVPPPPPTMEEIICKMVSMTLDKATMAKVTEADVLYDTAYVELMKIVENAMEIPVIEIREEIADIYNTAYKQFEYIIKEYERIEAERLWEKRMRKKYKRMIRRQDNFRGDPSPPMMEVPLLSTVTRATYDLIRDPSPPMMEVPLLSTVTRATYDLISYVTPPSTKSTVSSHESYKIPPPPPCVCHPQWSFNRYPKVKTRNVGTPSTGGVLT